MLRRLPHPSCRSVACATWTGGGKEGGGEGGRGGEGGLGEENKGEGGGCVLHAT